MPYYAVAKGRTSGIFMSWGDCEAQVKGFSGARYKKFDSAAAAEEFINSVNNKPQSQSRKSNNFAPQANTTNTNLKRSYSTPASTINSKQNEKTKSIKKTKAAKSDEESDFSDNSDDLNTIISKQMDDIEKRLNVFTKGVDKIMKKSTKTSERKTILLEPPQSKKARKSSSNLDFAEDTEGYVQVYTDGACSGNGRNGARAGLGVYWGDGHSLNISEPVSGRATNNCGEIQAATKAIRQALDRGITKLTINTDSQFLINSVTKWMSGWKKKGWKLKSGEPVKNEVDFKDLDSIVHKLQIRWNYVEAHKGIHGNEMADKLAKAGAEMFNNK